MHGIWINLSNVRGSVTHSKQQTQTIFIFCKLDTEQLSKRYGCKISVETCERQNPLV
jgi:hypothetical protein